MPTPEYGNISNLWYRHWQTRRTGPAAAAAATVVNMSSACKGGEERTGLGADYLDFTNNDDDNDRQNFSV